MRFLRAFAVLLSLCLVTPAMATDIQSTDYSETDASNNQTPPRGWPAGMNPAQVHPAARAMMGATKRFYDHINPTVTSAGTANVQTLSYSIAPAAYVTGDTYSFKVGSGLTNTGAATLNVNGLGAKAVQAGGAALIGGELGAGRQVTVAYDGTQFQLNNMGAPPLAMDCRQFGVTVSGDSTTAAQACLDAAYNSGAPVRVHLPTSFNFTRNLATYPGICVVGGGAKNPWHRTATGLGLYTATDPSHKSYPSSNVLNPCIEHVTIIADDGVAGTNIAIAWSAEYHLRDVNSFGTDTAAAQFTGSVSGNTLTVTGLNQGTIVAGQFLICQQCGYTGTLVSGASNMLNNSYPTISAFGTGGTTGVGGTGTYRISDTFNTAVASTPMLSSTPWTWASTGGTTSFPSANAYILGLSEGEWIGGALGNVVTPPGNTCGDPQTFTGIGLILDSIQADGGNKPNNNHFTGIKDWCNILGFGIFNGSDNTFIASLHQNTIIGKICGTGGSNCFRNLDITEYYEPQSSAPTGKAGVIYGPNGTDNTIWGLGSLGSSAFAAVILDVIGNNQANNEIRLNNDQTYHSGRVIHTFYSGLNLANPPAVPNLKTFLFDGDDTHHLEIAGKAYQSTETVIFSGNIQNGAHGSQAAIGGNQTMAVFGGRGLKDTTDGNFCGSSSSAPGGLPCGYMAIVSEAAFSNTSTPTRMENYTTQSGSTTPVLASLIDSAQNNILAPSAAVTTSATGPFVYLSTMAGAPSGVPSAKSAGRSAIVIDSANHKICFYENANSAWKCATGS